MQSTALVTAQENLLTFEDSAILLLTNLTLEFYKCLNIEVPRSTTHKVDYDGKNEVTITINCVQYVCTYDVDSRITKVGIKEYNSSEVIEINRLTYKKEFTLYVNEIYRQLETVIANIIKTHLSVLGWMKIANSVKFH